MVTRDKASPITFNSAQSPALLGPHHLQSSSFTDTGTSLFALPVALSSQTLSPATWPTLPPRSTLAALTDWPLKNGESLALSGAVSNPERKSRTAEIQAQISSRFEALAALLELSTVELSRLHYWVSRQGVFPRDLSWTRRLIRAVREPS